MRTWRLGAWSAALFTLLSATPGLSEVKFVGHVRETRVLERELSFVLDEGVVASVEAVGSEIVRVRVTPWGSFSASSSGAVVRVAVSPTDTGIADGVDEAVLQTQHLRVVVRKAPFRVIITRPDGTPVLADAEPAVAWETETRTIIGRKQAPQDEHYFGLGMRAGPVDRRGRGFMLVNVDWGGWESARDPFYVSIPFYYGLRQGRAYGLFLDNPAVPFFDMDSAGTGVVTFGALDGELDYYVMAGPAPQAVARAYAGLTGFPPLPPKWSLGYHQSRFGYKTQWEYLELAWMFRALAIPCDALYFDLFYLDRLRPFTWDPVNFPGPEFMNEQLRQRGFRTVAIVDPVVRSDDPLWRELEGAGLLLKRRDGTTLLTTIFYGEVSWLDFTSSRSRQWFAEALKRFMASGIDAIWNDLNEPAFPFAADTIYESDGQPRSEVQARNLYALLETAASYQAQREVRPNVRPWVLSRSGYAGIQRYAASWSGDALSTFEALRASVEMSLSMGLSGEIQFGHDVGGFLGSPSPELFIRWLQFGSLTPFFRTHSVHTQPVREPWRFGEPVTSIAREVINQRYRLIPYLYSLFEDASRTGQPVVAPTLFHFPEDERTYRQSTEFMLGPFLLVAPVVTEGQLIRTVYLPKGTTWTDVHGGLSYDGGQEVTVEAGLDRVPLFARSGAIIPTGPTLQHVDEPVPAAMAADVYAGPDSSFAMYEDDGISFDYERGMFVRTELRKVAQDGATVFSIRVAEGQMQVPARPWSVRFHTYAESPRGVELNGRPLQRVGSTAELEERGEGWFHDGLAQVIHVRLEAGSEASTIVIR